MTITRRQFLKGSAAAAAAATLGPHMRLLPGTDIAYAAGPGSRIVVVVQLNGGNDGINTVYPLNGTQRTKYDEYRPPGQGINLPVTSAGGTLDPWNNNGGFGTLSQILDIGTNGDGSDYAFHPAMTAFHQVYQDGFMAVCPGVHYTHFNHSHFRSEEIWYTGRPETNGGPGWFGAYLNTLGLSSTDVPGVMLGGSLNPVFTPTDVGLFAFKRLDDLEFPADGETVLKRDTLAAMYQETGALSSATFPELAKLGQTGEATLDKIQDYYLPGNGLANVAPVEALLADVADNYKYKRNNPLVYDSPLNAIPTSNRLARDLRHVAASIRADVDACYFHVDIGGFDTHSNQEKGLFHSGLLYKVSEAVAAFWNDMNSDVASSMPAGYSGYRTGNLANDVLIVTLSEFGRTMRQNNTSANAAGTDHAASAPQFVIGGKQADGFGGVLVGGHHGVYPQLDDPSDSRKNDLKMTTDIRDFYGTIMHKWLGMAPGDITGGGSPVFPTTTTPDEDGNTYSGYTSGMGYLV